MSTVGGDAEQQGTSRKAENQDDTLKIYELYLADVGRIGSRHETARQFYMGVITAIYGFIGFAGKDGILIGAAPWVISFGGLIGIIMCTLWGQHMKSFSVLFSTKLSIVEKMEGGFPQHPFTEERAAPNMQKRKRLTDIDQSAAQIVRLVFIFITVAPLALLAASHINRT
jgi:hypothetical protein